MAQKTTATSSARALNSFSFGPTANHERSWLKISRTLIVGTVVEEDVNDAAERALAPDHVGNDFRRHAVLWTPTSRPSLLRYGSISWAAQRSHRL